MVVEYIIYIYIYILYNIYIYILIWSFIRLIWLFSMCFVLHWLATSSFHWGAPLQEGPPELKTILGGTQNGGFLFGKIQTHG